MLPLNSYALELGLEQGSTGHFLASPQYAIPAKYEAITLRYGDSTYIEGIMSGWKGVNNSARFNGVSLGFRSSGKWFTEGSVGFGFLLAPETENLDGKYQFLLSAGIGYKYETLIITYKYRHLSNANTQGNNVGVDFKIISLSVIF